MTSRSGYAFPICRRATSIPWQACFSHFAGTLLVLLTLGGVLATQRWVFLWLLPVFGYGFAWLGHFAVGRNRPATFRHPLYSLIGDFRMFADMLRGRVPF